MKFECRLELTLFCDETDYVRIGGTDHRDSFPTVLNTIKKILVKNFYCGDDPGPRLYWDPVHYCRAMKESKRSPIQGTWEIPYVSVLCENVPDDLLRTECPAHKIKRTIRKPLKEALLQWGIDPLAYRFEIDLWNANTDPDFSSSCDFDDEDDEDGECVDE